MTVPAGIFAKPIHDMADLIAESTNFQAWVGEATATAAKAHIYISETDVDEDYIGNWCTTNGVEGFKMRRYAAGTGLGSFEYQSGSVFAFFSTQAVLHVADDAIVFQNTISAIIEDITNLQFAGFKAIDNIDRLEFDQFGNRVSLKTYDGSLFGFQMHFKEWVDENDPTS